MKISKRSWHYHLHDPEHPPKNLCTYFWLTVLTLILIVGVGGLLLFGIGWLVYQGFVVRSIGWMLLSAGGLIWLGARRWRKRTHKPLGVVRSYIRAKKDRVCPLIEYTV